MFHKIDRVCTGSGAALAGWQIECVQNSDLTTVVPIYANESSTPISTVSGVVNRAVSDAQGNYDFFVTEGTYGIKFYDSIGTYQATQRYVQMYAGTVSGKVEATAIGISDAAVNMGTFTGTTIPDNVTAKAALQALETSLDTFKASVSLPRLSSAPTGVSGGAMYWDTTLHAPQIYGDDGAWHAILIS